MARKKTPASKPKPKSSERRHGRIGWKIAGIAVLLLALLTAYMSIEANVVTVDFSDVYIENLPEAFEYTTILFLTDTHVGNLCAPEKSAALISQLQALNPDLLLLGGDYSALDFVDYARAVTGIKALDEARRSLAARRDQFFLRIGAFSAPLGKFAVPGNHDYELTGLEDSAALGGVTLLKNSGKALERDGQRLIIAGLDDWRKGAQDPAVIASAVRSEDCVILLSHNPDALPAVASVQSADGGPWVDLMLSGHTHGGQIALFGHGLFSSSIYGNRYLSGWYEDKGVLLLVSNGVGDFLLPLRLGAPPKAHLITLRRKEVGGSPAA